MQTEVGRSLEAGEFSVYYQPRLSIETGACVSVEALLRWTARPGSTPGDFIPNMEQNGDMSMATTFVVDTVCRDIWRMKGVLPGPIPKVSINIAPSLFLDDLFVTRLLNDIGSRHVRPAEIELEITESSVLQDFDAVISSAAALRTAGFDLALDDFGTGLSSLHYLDLLPVSVIKIDRHFVGGIGVRRASDQIVASIIRLAKDMSMVAVAEGVETQAQFDYVAAHGCDEVQGYLLAKPMPFNEFLAFFLANCSPAGVGKSTIAS